MAGISSKAAGKLENKRKYNDGSELESKEFSDGSGLDLYSTEFRKYDHQIGRFIQIDALAEISFEYSTYAYSNNNPILLNDPLGLFSDSTDAPGFDNSKGRKAKELTGVEVVAKKRETLDTENGQVLPSLSWWDRIWSDVNGRCWAPNYNKWHVNNDGYLTGHPYIGYRKFELTLPIDRNPVTSLKAVFRLKNFIKERYLIYRGLKNGKLYIGKAKESLKARYGSQSNVDDIFARAIDGLDNIPNNAVALGVEQIIIDLNGGIKSGNLANKIPATVKEIYINEARIWLDTSIPNWEILLKFQ
jgi:RHS repeat-associated protein